MFVIKAVCHFILFLCTLHCVESPLSCKLSVWTCVYLYWFFVNYVTNQGIVGVGCDTWKVQRRYRCTSNMLEQVSSTNQYTKEPRAPPIVLQHPCLPISCMGRCYITLCKHHPGTESFQSSPWSSQTISRSSALMSFMDFSHFRGISLGVAIYTSQVCPCEGKGGIFTTSLVTGTPVPATPGRG